VATTIFSWKKKKDRFQGSREGPSPTKEKFNKKKKEEKLKIIEGGKNRPCVEKKKKKRAEKLRGKPSFPNPGKNGFPVFGIMKRGTPRLRILEK